MKNPDMTLFIKNQLSRGKGPVGLNPEAWTAFWLMYSLYGDGPDARDISDVASDMVMFVYKHIKEYEKEAADE